MELFSNQAIIGHARIVTHLRKTAGTNHRHAYLFAGPDHMGKETVARFFIGAIYGRQISSWDELAAHPDFALLTVSAGKKNISVEDTRRFLRHFQSSSLLGGVKVGLIPKAEDLSTEAANALLKTLEEPLGDALILLICSELGNIPATVISRCQLMRFLPVPTDEIYQGLVRRGVPKEEAQEAACLAVNRPGIAIGCARSTQARKEHQEKVHAFLSFLNAPLWQRLKNAGEMVADAATPALRDELRLWLGVIRDMLIVSAGNENGVINRFALPTIKDAARRTGMTRAAALSRTVIFAERLLRENVNPRLIFEHIALSI